MKNILLINATTYDVQLPNEAQILRSNYSRAKSCIKKRKIPDINPMLICNTRSYSVGLLRIGTILKENGFAVQYRDFEDTDWETLEALLENVDLIAFGAITPTVPRCAQLCQRIKQVSPSITVAIGGAHINVAKSITQDRYPCFDIYADGYDVAAAAKLVGKPENSLTLPKEYVDYSLLPYPLSEYILNTFTTLGCTYRCDYCQDHRIPYYENSDVTGLRHLIGKVPRGSRVHYFDSILGVKEVRTKQVCEALSKIDHGFLLSCDARAEMITPEIVQMMEGAGFTEISFGMETADEAVLRANKRTLSTERLSAAFDVIRNYSNMYISVYNAIGIPGSTIGASEKSREVLIDWLQNDRIDEIKTCIYVPYPMDGKNYRNRGVILDTDDWSLFDRQSFPVYHLEHMTSQEIWDESIKLMEASVNAWIKKLGFDTIDDLPNEYWIEYLTKHNYLIH